MYIPSVKSTIYTDGNIPSVYADGITNGNIPSVYTDRFGDGIMSVGNYYRRNISVARRKTPRGVPVLAMTVLLSVIGIDFVGSRHLVFN